MPVNSKTECRVWTNVSCDAMEGSKKHGGAYRSLTIIVTFVFVTALVQVGEALRFLS